MRAPVSASNDPPSSDCSSHNTTRAPPADAASSSSQAGRPGTDHQHVAMRIVMQVAIGVGHSGRSSETSGSANRRLVDMSPERTRPHEGLVVETSRKYRGNHVVDRSEIEGQRREAILAECSHSVIQLELRRAQVRCDTPGTSINRHQRIGLLRPSGHDAARPMILERTADQMNAIGQQRRGKRVTLRTNVSFAVEAE